MNKFCPSELKCTTDLGPGFYCRCRSSSTCPKNSIWLICAPSVACCSHYRCYFWLTYCCHYKCYFLLTYCSHYKCYFLLTYCCHYKCYFLLTYCSHYKCYFLLTLLSLQVLLPADIAVTTSVTSCWHIAVTHVLLPADILLSLQVLLPADIISP